MYIYLNTLILYKATIKGLMTIWRMWTERQKNRQTKIQ